ncbi:MAG: helix-turn-helix domain-containing protein [Flavobacteriaceae bacterium]|nr:helix-turn-helix domain-containing protein [Flavobacteriaceae bacterium]
MTFGSVLLRNRVKNNYTQNQVAELLQVSQSTYCDWESGSAIPKTENLIKVASLYNLDLNELLASFHQEKVNIVNSPNTISNSPNSKIETTEALVKIAENIEKLVVLIEKLYNKE